MIFVGLLDSNCNSLRSPRVISIVHLPDELAMRYEHP